ncbi:cell wall hydrolase [Sphingomonas sp. PL-96]|uniref:cell wall hydrolase n=1 Tax=Sphingomonas sp. PL-96 TaxID=2887201 RepID=UPI001E5F976D|nr:cell wall hydrolase [Sphingomonas sp. PL-96]MCC2978362.1 cell wall hydrolase [Sphingomonas sp. PL-96]
MRSWGPLRTRRRAVLLLAGGAGLAFAVHAGSIAVDQQQRAAARRMALPPRSSAQAQAPVFSGALAAPQAGTTGTTTLPDLPIPALALEGDGSIVPAQPFHARGSVIDQARALECLTTAIYYEAANEPDDGQQAVAQVVLNRVRHPAFPATVCGVVYQGSERRGCQFSFACDGALARARAPGPWARARRVAARALSGSVFAPVGLATHYHTYAVTPAWNRSLVMTGAFGAHFFHRWKGWWGTADAFADRYVGHEPVPGPHVRSPLDPLPLPQPTTAAPAEAAPAEPLPVAPRTAPTPAPQPPENSLPESAIRDRWKDSGKPLR